MCSDRSVESKNFPVCRGNYVRPNDQPKNRITWVFKVTITEICLYRWCMDRLSPWSSPPAWSACWPSIPTQSIHRPSSSSSSDPCPQGIQYGDWMNIPRHLNNWPLLSQLPWIYRFPSLTVRTVMQVSLGACKFLLFLLTSTPLSTFFYTKFKKSYPSKRLLRLPCTSRKLFMMYDLIRYVYLLNDQCQAHYQQKFQKVSCHFKLPTPITLSIRPLE